MVKFEFTQLIIKNNLNNYYKMLDLLPILISLASVLIIAVSIFNKSFKDGKPTCQQYILNTYLYIALGIILITSMFLVNDKGQILLSTISLGLTSIIGIIVFIIVWLLLMYIIHTLPAKYYPLTHVLWLLAMYILACIFYPLYLLGKEAGVITVGVLITLAIVIVTSLIGYFKGDVFKVDLKKYLRFALLALIISEVAAIYLIKDYELLIKVVIGLSFIGVIIFGLFILAYTKDLKERSKKCVEANYPAESVKFIMSMLNMFADIIRILALTKGRKRLG